MSFTLETPKERAALASLQPITGLPQAEFHQHVIFLLSHIRDPRYRHDTRRSPAQTVRKLKRWAQAAQRFARGLEQQPWDCAHPYTLLPDPPINTLRDYAAKLLERAAAVQKSQKVGADRHRTHSETNDVVMLCRMIEKETGKPNWEAVTTLVQAATRDVGFGKDRLRKLVKYHDPKSKAWKRGQDTATTSM